jgi:hypothetical protein
MGQEFSQLAQPQQPGLPGNVGQQHGRYQEGTAPVIGADPKAKQMPPGPELGGLPGLTPPEGQPSQSPEGMDRLKMLMAQLMAAGKGR